MNATISTMFTPAPPPVFVVCAVNTWVIEHQEWVISFDFSTSVLVYDNQIVHINKQPSHFFR
jgi:hypothetical protein